MQISLHIGELDQIALKLSHFLLRWDLPTEYLHTVLLHSAITAIDRLVSKTDSPGLLIHSSLLLHLS